MVRTRFLPQLYLTVNGTTLGEPVVHALSEVRVQQRLSLPTLCELVFLAPPSHLYSYLLSSFKPGSPLQLAIDDSSRLLFVGEIAGIECVYGAAHGQEIRVRAFDSMQKLRRRQSVRPYVQIKLAELAAELTGDLRIAVQGGSGGQIWQRIINSQPSDLDFLTALAEQEGLYWILRGGTLYLCDWNGIGPTMALEPGLGLLEARFEINGESETGTVVAEGWNPQQAESFTGQSAAGGAGTYTLLNAAVQDNPHAQALAQAELGRRRANVLTFRGVADGNPELAPGSVVQVVGVAEPLAGRYLLTAVNHTIDGRSGYLVELSSVPPAPREAAGGGDRFTLGVVTAVDDPERLGRVRAVLPAYGHVETGWMQVLSPGAGSNKGLTALPNVQDHILVCLLQADPGCGIVLGGLYGMQGPPECGVVGGQVQIYTLCTPGGIQIRLDDAQQSLKIQNGQGSYLELGPQQVTLHAAVKLLLEAPGQNIEISGSRIDFKKG